MIDTTNRNSALASALVEELARCGATTAIVSPGSRSSPVTLALDREPGIELRVILDERSGGFVALGVALATGVPAVVACTSGSAAANLHPAVVEADQAGVPMIVLTSDRPPELRGIGAGQTIDQIGLYGSAARWFSEVGTHEGDYAGLIHMRSTGCRAYGEAMRGRGPVHLNLPWRDPLGPEERRWEITATEPIALDGRSGRRPLTVPIEGREPAEALNGAIAEAVARAMRGVIVAGRHLEPDLPAAIAALAVQTGFPVLAEPTSQMRFGSHNRDLVISAYDSIARARPHSLSPDLILRFGDMPTSKPLRAWIEESEADQIVIDPPSTWNEPTRVAGAFIRADPVAVAVELAERASAGRGEWTESWTAAERTAQDAIDAVLADAGGLNEPALHRSLGPLFADGDRVLLASSMPVRDAESFLRGGGRDVSFFSNRGANGIDGLVSTAAGLATGCAGTTWVVLGDLALQHDLGGLASLGTVDSAIRLVVIDNGGGGIFDFLPQAGQVEGNRFERLFTTPSSLEIERVAALFDLPYVPIAELTQLERLTDRSRALAHVRVSREGNVELHRRISAAVADALAGE